MTLSGPAQTVLESLQQLPVADREQINKLEATALATEISQAAQTAGASRRANANSVLRQGVAEKLILNAGGIFLGEKQLKELGVISIGVTLPPVPDQFSEAFLNAPHPLRGGRIAEHIILGFDPTTKNWYCFEKSIVPRSVDAKTGIGMCGLRQGHLLQDDHGHPETVGRMEYTSPRDYRPIKSVLDNVIKLQLKAGEKYYRLPFHRVYGRTADKQNADRGCRVLLGYSDLYGSNVYCDCPANSQRYNVGLLAGWNLKFDR
jgi:hypothetical protein